MGRRRVRVAGVGAATSRPPPRFDPASQRIELRPRLRSRARPCPALSAALAGRGAVFLLAPARAALLAAASFLVDGGPGAAFGFLSFDATLLVTLLDVLGLALLLAAVTRLVAAWHGAPPIEKRCAWVVRATTRVPTNRGRANGTTWSATMAARLLHVG